MVEKIFNLSKGDEKAVEKLIFDENLHYLHMVFNQDEGLPEHFSNSNVYLVIVSGQMTLTLDEQNAHRYTRGEIINIPLKLNVNYIFN